MFEELNKQKIKIYIYLKYDHSQTQYMLPMTDPPPQKKKHQIWKNHRGDQIWQEKYGFPSIDGKLTPLHIHSAVESSQALQMIIYS